jgi:hypothetical protein
MVETTVVWIGLAATLGVAGVAVAARQFAATGDRPLLPLAFAAVAFAGVFELGHANGYFRPTAAAVLTVGFLLVGVALLAVAVRDRRSDT